MAIPAQIRTFLERTGVPYEVLPYAGGSSLCKRATLAGVAWDQVARAVPFHDADGLVSAVVPACHLLDVLQLRAVARRDLEPARPEHFADKFPDCAAALHPVLAGAYGVGQVVDDALAASEYVVLEAGDGQNLLRLPGPALWGLWKDQPHGSFSRAPGWADEAGDIEADVPGAPMRANAPTARRIKRQIEEFHELPAMPATAGRILQLYGDPDADARDLAAVVEVDPSLAAQVIRYASSPYYGYKGRVTSIHEAISRVLGFDMVLNLAMGIAIGKSFRVPAKGPLGLRAFWKHAVYCATLTERLARALPRQIRPRTGRAYLAGLLHNLGRLLLCHVFPAECGLLSRYLLANPELPVIEIERHVVGVGHERIGGWLMQIWGMPEELCVAVRWHHDENYWGKHALYSQLVLVANRLLKTHGIGDSEDDGLPAAVLEIMELDDEQALAVSERVLKNCEHLDDLATQLTA